MMDGITVLSETVIPIMSDVWVWNGLAVFLFILAMVGLIGILLEVTDIIDWDGVAFVGGFLALIFGLLFCLLAGITKVQVDEYTIYKVTIDEYVSLTEFNERYEIKDQDGQIYSIVERDTEDAVE